MATYKYNKGSNTVSRSVIVDDAFEDSTDVVADLVQPAGSVISKILVRIVEAPESTGNANWGYKVGTASDDDAFAIDADGFDAAGTGPAANTLVNATVTSFTSATAGTAAVGYSADERTLKCALTCSDPTSVDTAGKAEFTIFFDILPKS